MKVKKVKVEPKSRLNFQLWKLTLLFCSSDARAAGITIGGGYVSTTGSTMVGSPWAEAMGTARLTMGGTHLSLGLTPFWNHIAPCILSSRPSPVDPAITASDRL